MDDYQKMVLGETIALRITGKYDNIADLTYGKTARLYRYASNGSVGTSRKIGFGYGYGPGSGAGNNRGGSSKDYDQFATSDSKLFIVPLEAKVESCHD